MDFYMDFMFYNFQYHWNKIQMQHPLTKRFSLYHSMCNTVLRNIISITVQNDALW